MKKTFSILLIIALIVGAGFGLGRYILTTNDAGFYQVKQAAITGNLSVRNEPGLYGRWFGKITTYQISDMNYFSDSALEGGTGEEAAPITVRFNDGGTAEISGSIKFRLSLMEEDQIALHEEFKTYASVQRDMVRQVVTEALMQTASIMKAEESYSSRRSEFTSLAEAQIRQGIFETVTKEEEAVSGSDKGFKVKTTEIVRDENGMPVIRKPSSFARYNIEILQFVIKEIEFDSTIDALIAQKKEAEQQRVVAEANAERAKQDAITAKAQGDAKVAKARAEEEVIKVRAVTQAEKELEVAELNRKKALENAAALLAEKEAEARAARLLVQAGLPPLEKAKIEKETAIGVAAEMAKLKFPEMMIIGGNEGSAANPFDAVGLESFMRISKELANQ